MMTGCSMAEPVAAIYVDTAHGPYPRIPGVECWGFATRDGAQMDAFAANRDARLYDGPHPVIAHPPCGPWGRFWWNYGGGEGAKECGPRAVEQVRRWGGVLEHPEHSNMWDACDLPRPGAVDAWGGRTIRVEQVDWGHPAVKATWLYIVGRTDVPPMPPPGKPTHAMVRLLRNSNDLPEMPKRYRHLTPLPFAAWLVDLARGCVRP